MTISALAIAAAAVWPALDASDAAIYRSIREPRVVAVQPNHTHKEMVLMPDGEVRYYGKDLEDGRPREVYLSSRDRGLSLKTKLCRSGDLGEYLAALGGACTGVGAALFAYVFGFRLS